VRLGLGAGINNINTTTPLWTLTILVVYLFHLKYISDVFNALPTKTKISAVKNMESNKCGYLLHKGIVACLGDPINRPFMDELKKYSLS
jgi:hypothetical protein